MSPRTSTQPAPDTLAHKHSFTSFRKYFCHIEPVYRLLMSELLLDESLNHELLESYRMQVAQIESNDRISFDIEKLALHIHDLAFRMYADCWNREKPSWCYLALALDIKTEEWLYSHELFDVIENVYCVNM